MTRRRSFTDRWIPVSKRLPQAGTECIVTATHRFTYKFDEPCVMTCWFDGHVFTDDEEYETYKVTAWMAIRMPEKPYKERAR